MNEEEQRFWQKVKKSNCCWIWTASVASTGYGFFRNKATKSRYAHIYAWYLAHKEQPNEPVIQLCGNRRCVRPDHLALSTKLFRFMRHVVKTPDHWLWVGHKNRCGYGVWDDKSNDTYLAHRWSWLLHIGPINKDILVLHRCDTPACVKPGHLFLGTHADNVDDKVTKGRQLKGEQIKSHKLTESMIAEIRSLYKTGLYYQGDLGEKYGVDRRTIGQIVSLKTWKHIP